MANSSKISRRNFMQQSALWAAAFAGGTAAVPGIASAAREKELNILCWEGYNSAQVLDPFRSSTGATVKAESLTNDPTMINRLRAGETNVWDLINVNNPWARKVMFPEKLIKPLDRAKFEPYFSKMLPAFKPPYKWAMDDGGTELLGMCQRFGPYSFVVNTDKVSRATAEDQGWNLWNDPANAKKYGILESDDWNVFCICCIAGFDPFKVHSDDEVAKFTEAAKRVFKGAKLVGDGQTLVGFILGRALATRSLAQIRAIYAELGEQAQQGILTAPVEKVYSIEEIKAAVAHAERGERAGKILVAPNGQARITAA